MVLSVTLINMFLHLSICSVSLTVVSTIYISLIFFNILCIAHCLQCTLYHLFSVTLTVALYYLCFFQYSLYHLYFLVFPVTLTVYSRYSLYHLHSSICSEYHFDMSVCSLSLSMYTLYSLQCVVYARIIILRVSGRTNIVY